MVGGEDDREGKYVFGFTTFSRACFFITIDELLHKRFVIYE